MPLRAVVILAVLLIPSCATVRYVDAPARYGWTSPILVIPGHPIRGRVEHI